MDIRDVEKLQELIPGPALKLSDKSRFFLSKIIDLCKISMKSIPKFEINAMGESLPKNDMYNIIPAEIRQSKYMELAPHKSTYTASVNLSGRKYNFTVVQFQKGSLTQVNDIIRLSCVWLQIASVFAPIDCSKIVDIYFYMTDAKKMLPQRATEYIDEVHVNTAFTTSCLPKTTIILFRKEEWFKVFIHETFHNLGLDFAKSNLSNAEILRIFQVNSDVRLYETYCEMHAEIINVIIQNVIRHPRTQTDNMFKYIERDLQIERTFSLFQTVKILNHFGMRYVDFLNPTNLTVREKYKERTSILSYFMFKTILMNDFNRFIEWCLTNNRGSLRFSNPETNEIKYARELILSQYNRPDLLMAIENVEKKQIGMRKTLRMSVFG